MLCSSAMIPPPTAMNDMLFVGGWEKSRDLLALPCSSGLPYVGVYYHLGVYYHVGVYCDVGAD